MSPQQNTSSIHSDILSIQSSLPVTVKKTKKDFSLSSTPADTVSSYDSGKIAQQIEKKLEKKEQRQNDMIAKKMTTLLMSNY